MSPTWARRGGWAIYLYAKEPHRVPHVAVRGPDFRANVRISDGAVLAGDLPPQVLREVRSLLADHRELAIEAFEQTLAHAFPGTLEEMLDRVTPAEEVNDDDERS
jgi:hypothetical protein